MPDGKRAVFPNWQISSSYAPFISMPKTHDFPKYLKDSVRIYCQLTLIREFSGPSPSPNAGKIQIHSLWRHRICDTDGTKRIKLYVKIECQLSYLMMLVLNGISYAAYAYKRVDMPSWTQIYANFWVNVGFFPENTLGDGP